MASFQTDIYGTTVSASVSISNKGRAFLSSAGEVFVFEVQVGGTDIMFASDPTSSPFSDAATGLTGELADVVQVGDVLHILLIDGSANSVLYRQYDMATDTLGSAETVASGTGVSLDGSAKVQVRSNGEVVAFYRAPNGGGGVSRLSYRIRSSGGSWGTATVVHSAAAGTILLAKALVPGTSGRLHMVYGFATSAVVQRSFTSANVVGSETALFTSDFLANRVTFPHDFTPTSDVYLGFLSSTSRASVATFASADTPSAPSTAEVATEPTVPELAYDGATMWALYADSDGTREVLVETDTGSGWGGTPVLVQSPPSGASTAAVYGGNRYVRAGRTVLAYTSQFTVSGGSAFRYFYGEHEVGRAARWALGKTI